MRTEQPIPNRFGSAFLELDQRLDALRDKLGAHAHERMKERTAFHPSHVDMIQRAVDTLELPKERYHLPLRHQDGSIAGYAQFKGVENRKTPVLATILGPAMTPSGPNIEGLIKLNRFIEQEPQRRFVGDLERPGRQETDAYVIHRAFTNLTQPTGAVMEHAR